MAVDPLPPRPSDGAVDAETWLDGLAGRPGEGASHAEGQVLRESLLTPAPAQAAAAVRPPWSALEADAARGDTRPAAAQAAAPLVQAANDAPVRWRGHTWGALAAGLVLAAGLLVALLHTREDDNPPVLRGIAPAVTGQAADIWYVNDPVSSAETLATALRNRGAGVVVTPAGAGVDMVVTVPAQHTDAVASLLASIKVGIGPEGRVLLAVRPAP